MRLERIPLRGKSVQEFCVSVCVCVLACAFTRCAFVRTRVCWCLRVRVRVCLRVCVCLRVYCALELVGVCRPVRLHVRAPRVCCGRGYLCLRVLRSTFGPYCGVVSPVVRMYAGRRGIM